MTAVRATLSRSRRVRYAAPALVAVVALGAGPFVNAVTADAHGSLPPRTAAQLLVDVQQAKLRSLSGTVVETSALGLPALPSIGGAGGGSADFSSLISGSHTMRVWVDGPDRARVALLGRLGESDLVRNGSDVWLWSSAQDTVTHALVPAGPTEGSGIAVANGAMTPQEAADAALKAIRPSTEISTDPTAVVAGRPAYQLLLVPRDPRTLVGSVRIAIDGATRVPTRVQVFARGASAPAFEIGYTSMSTAKPAASVFDFTPPPGAKVKELSSGLAGHDNRQQELGSAAPHVFGRGWTTVLVAHLPDTTTATSSMLKVLPTVSGSWGSGRLLRGALFSAVLTDDGRVAIGAVPPSLLYAALAGT